MQVSRHGVRLSKERVRTMMLLGCQNMFVWLPRKLWISVRKAKWAAAAQRAC